MKNLIEFTKNSKNCAFVYFATTDSQIRKGLINVYFKLKDDYEMDFFDHNVYCGLKILVEGMTTERQFLVKELKEQVREIIEKTLKTL